MAVAVATKLAADQIVRGGPGTRAVWLGLEDHLPRVVIATTSQISGLRPPGPAATASPLPEPCLVERPELEPIGDVPEDALGVALLDCACHLLQLAP